MINIKIGDCQVEVEAARRVTVIYGDSDRPRYLMVVGDDGEAWSLADFGGELGTQPKGVTVHRARKAVVKLA